MTVMMESDSESNKVEHIFHQNVSRVLSNIWLLVDNQSTVDQCVNPKYITKIHIVNRSV